MKEDEPMTVEAIMSETGEDVICCTIYDTRCGMLRLADALLIAQAPAMRAALLKARETIKALHGDEAWDIYEADSPEMKQIDGVLRAIGAA